ncbi:MAG: hypothetical protein HOJ57_33610, partial [Lentisphaerae bacterium]|nr:hypothetical protein [Lentisphaerota bacterium]
MQEMGLAAAREQWNNSQGLQALLDMLVPLERGFADNIQDTEGRVCLVSDALAIWPAMVRDLNTRIQEIQLGVGRGERRRCCPDNWRLPSFESNDDTIRRPSVAHDVRQAIGKLPDAVAGNWDNVDVLLQIRDQVTEFIVTTPSSVQADLQDLRKMREAQAQQSRLKAAVDARLKELESEQDDPVYHWLKELEALGNSLADSVANFVQPVEHGEGVFVVGWMNDPQWLLYLGDYRTTEYRHASPLSEQIRELKEGRDDAVVESFVDLLSPLIDGGHPICVVPSHVPKNTDSGMAQLARALAERSGGIDATHTLVREHKIRAVHRGKDRGIEQHLASIGV